MRRREFLKIGAMSAAIIHSFISIIFINHNTWYGCGLLGGGQFRQNPYIFSHVFTVLGFKIHYRDTIPYRKSIKI